MGRDVRRVSIDGTRLDVVDRGSGEPVVFIQTALVADELLSIAAEPALADRYRVIGYHRRGYAGSTATAGPGSIERDAADCQAVLTALGIGRAHVVGYSYSCAVALQLAVNTPDIVHTLALLAPPPLTESGRRVLAEASTPAVETYRAGDSAGAVDRIMSLVGGPQWRTQLEQRVPGGTEQAEKDAGTFFETDLPALLHWRFDPDRARTIPAAVLHMDGSDSGPLFAEVRDILHSWLRQTEDVIVPGAGHSLSLTHPTQVATSLADFLERHRIGE